MNTLLLILELFIGVLVGFLIGLFVGYIRMVHHLRDHPESPWWNWIFPISKNEPKEDPRD